MACRAGFALPAALAAVVLLAGVAALANVAAMSALREATASNEEGRAVATRASLRARVRVVLAEHAAGELTSTAIPVGGGDTVLVTRTVVWPWFRLTVESAGSPLIAEAGRGNSPTVPWCSAAVVAGTSSITGTLALDPPGACSTALTSTTPSALDDFAAQVNGAVVAGPVVDDLLVTSDPIPGAVVIARNSIVITPGVSVQGLIISPIVRIDGGATVRGMVVARDILDVSAGAQVVGDAFAVATSLSSNARVHTIGRRGILLPP
jgi:type II secretory pathway pseudopilin PulG